MKKTIKLTISMVVISIMTFLPTEIKAAKVLECKYDKNVVLNQNVNGNVTISKDGTNVDSTIIHNISNLDYCPEYLYYQPSKSYCSGEIGWRTFSTKVGRCTNNTYTLDATNSTETTYKVLNCQYNNGEVVFKQTENGNMTLTFNNTVVDQDKIAFDNQQSCPAYLYYNKNSSYCGFSGWNTTSSSNSRCNATKYVWDNLSNTTTNTTYPELTCNYSDGVILHQSKDGTTSITGHSDSANNHIKNLQTCLDTIYYNKNGTYCQTAGFATAHVGGRCSYDQYDLISNNTDNTGTNTNNNNNTNNDYATECDFIGNLSCGGTDFQFHKSLPNFTSTIFNILKIITPVIVIITGMLDLLKAVSAQKEDEIKKGQQKLLRRLLAGAIVFLVFVIVETVIHMFAEAGEAENAMDCVDCFLNGSSYCTPNPVTCNNGSTN